MLSDSYKTLRGQCPAVQQLLQERAVSSEGLVGQDDSSYFESAALIRFTLAPAS